MRRLAAVAIAALTVLSLATGCGDDPAVDHRASRALNDQIDLVEFAIAAHQYDAAREGLTQVRQSAQQFADRDAISSARLPAILTALDDLDQALVDAEASA